MTTSTRPAKPGKKIDDAMFRGGRAPVKAEELKIERDGGRFGGGIIRGVSLIAAGEALGHDLWIDSEMVEQVNAALAARESTGVKSRFTHPGMSSDGMGRHLGRLHSGRVEGDRSLADLHFAMSAHDTPDGDLADYVMTLAGEDPEAAGLSIVFARDKAAETEFLLANGAEADRHGYVDYDGFKSPDPANVNNLPHARLAELRAADVVDEPAANPDGLFDRQSLARDAESLLSFAIGLTDEKPKSAVLGVDPERATQFLNRFLSGHRSALLEKLNAMSTDAPVEETPTTDPAPVVDPTPPTKPATEPAPELSERQKVTAELAKFTAKFGGESGAKYFSEGKSYTEGLEAHCESLTAQRDAALAEAKEAKEKLASLELGEHEPLATGRPSDSPAAATLKSAIKIRQ